VYFMEQMVRLSRSSVKTHEVGQDCSDGDFVFRVQSIGSVMIRLP
jgi:hypothetical protein